MRRQTAVPRSGNTLPGIAPYRVITFASPEAAISRNLTASPGAVIAVHELGQNGILFLKNLREREMDIPVIILAAAYDPEAFRTVVANRAEYLVMAGPADTWYPVLVQLLEKVSAIRRAQDEVVVLKRKLSLVGSVTRHDVLNQLTAVGGYTELLQMMVEDPQMKSYIGKIRSALDKIRRQFQFAKDYQNLGTEPPQWQSLASLIRRASDLVSLNGVTITVPAGTPPCSQIRSLKRPWPSCWTMLFATEAMSRLYAYLCMMWRTVRCLLSKIMARAFLLLTRNGSSSAGSASIPAGVSFWPGRSLRSPA